MVAAQADGIVVINGIISSTANLLMAWPSLLGPPPGFGVLIMGLLLTLLLILKENYIALDKTYFLSYLYIFFKIMIASAQPHTDVSREAMRDVTRYIKDNDIWLPPRTETSPDALAWHDKLVAEGVPETPVAKPMAEAVALAEGETVTGEVVSIFVKATESSRLKLAVLAPMVLYPNIAIQNLSFICNLFSVYDPTATQFNDPA